MVEQIDTARNGIETDSTNLLSPIEVKLLGHRRGDSNNNLSPKELLQSAWPDQIIVDDDHALGFLKCFRRSIRSKIGYELPFGEERFLDYGPIRIDNEDKTVFIEGQEVKMYPMEFKTLTLLMEKEGGLVDHVSLYVRPRGTSYIPTKKEITSTNIISYYISSLRKTIGSVTNRVKIANVSGQGYRLEETDGIGEKRKTFPENT